MIQDWLREDFRDHGISIVQEWSQPDEMGQMYVVEHIGTKIKNRVPERALIYYLYGIKDGRKR